MTKPKFRSILFYKVDAFGVDHFETIQKSVEREIYLAQDIYL